MDLKWKYSISLICIIMAVVAADANIVINEMLANPASDWNRNGEVVVREKFLISVYNFYCSGGAYV